MRVIWGMPWARTAAAPNSVSTTTAPLRIDLIMKGVPDVICRAARVASDEAFGVVQVVAA
jgi:hypothetical protein